jgi:hypothetical protein
VNAGRLEIDLVSGIARLQRDMQEATGIIRQGASTIDSILSKVGAGLTVGAITLFAKHTVDAIAKMKDLGIEVGTSAEAISRFEAPTRSAGLSLDDTATAMFRMSKAALEAKDPTSKAAQALQAIGISTNQLKGLKADEMFELVARQIAKYSEGIGRNNVMMELFSKSGREMNRVVEEIAKSQALAATVTEQQVEEAKKLGDQMLELKMNSEKMWRGLISEGVPAVNAILKAFIDARKEGSLWDAALRALFETMSLIRGETIDDDLKRVNEAIDLARKNVDRANTGFLGLLHTDEERADLTTKLNKLLAERDRLESVISARGIAEQDARANAGKAPKKPDPNFDPNATANAKIGLDLLVKLREEYAKLNNETQQNVTYERTLIELKKDGYAKLTPERRQEIIDEAKHIDQKLEELRIERMLDAEHKADVEYTDRRGQALADLANSWEDATTEMQQEADLLGLSNVDRQKAILLEKARLDIIAAGGDAAAIRDINKNLQAQLGLLDQINEKQHSLDIWNHLGDMAGEFANALTHGVGSAFDYLKQQAKQLLAEMIAIFAKRWVLQLAAGATGSTALSAAAGQVGEGSLAGSLGNWIGSSSLGTSLFGTAADPAAILASGGMEGLATSGLLGSGGLMSTIGSAMPIIGAVFAAYALYKAFADKGENWQGQLGFGANAHAYTNSGPFGAEGFNFVQGQDATNRAMQAFFASTGGIDRQLAGGLTTDQIARITSNLGGSYATRNDGQPSTFAFGEGDTTAAQQFTLEYLQKKYGTVFDEIDHTFADFIRNYTGDSAGLMQAIGEFAAVMGALQDSPVPGLSIESLRAMQREGEKLNDTFNAVTSAWSQYVDLFYTDAEKQQMGMEMLHHQFETLGVEMPKTREEFRHLIETTDHNSPLFRALLELAPAFADLVPAINDAGDAVGGMINGLARAMEGNPLGRGTDSAFQFGHIPGGSTGTSGTSGSAGTTGTSGIGETGTGTSTPPSDLPEWLAGALGGSTSPLSPAERLEALKQAWMANPTAATSSAYIAYAQQVYGSTRRPTATSSTTSTTPTPGSLARPTTTRAWSRFNPSPSANKPRRRCTCRRSPCSSPASMKSSAAARPQQRRQIWSAVRWR